MLIMNLVIGSVTPPVGSVLFVGCGVGKVKIEGVTRYILPMRSMEVKTEQIFMASHSKYINFSQREKG